jgi:hypothetical protein
MYLKHLPKAPYGQDKSEQAQEASVDEEVPKAVEALPNAPDGEDTSEQVQESSVDEEVQNAVSASPKATDEEDTSEHVQETSIDEEVPRGADAPETTPEQVQEASIDEEVPEAVAALANVPGEEDAPETVLEAAKLDEEAPKPFYARPSVGTWLAPSPLKMAIAEVPQISPAKLECPAIVPSFTVPSFPTGE